MLHGLTFDQSRRRVVLFGGAALGFMFGPQGDTWEFDGVQGTWEESTPAPSPGGRQESPLVYDPARAAVLLFGGQGNAGFLGDTWEYSVTGLGLGDSCDPTFASRCASGNCVDGACCEVAGCTGPCRSCNVAGMAGKCVIAAAGTVVAGSCSGSMACDGTGSCKSANGQACTGNDGCASGHCADGVCCDTSCTGACLACNQPGSAGRCRPYLRGTDPENECAGGGVCGATCDGVSGCAFPSPAAPCGTCGACDGAGMCREPGVCYPDGGFYPYDAYPLPRSDRPVFPPPFSDAARRFDAPRSDGRPVDAPAPLPTDVRPPAVDGAPVADGARPDDAAGPGPSTDAAARDGRSVDGRTGDAGDGGVKVPGLSSSGCGCDLGGQPPRRSSGALAALALAVVLRRRRRGGQ